jgi:hypothetical protein
MVHGRWSLLGHRLSTTDHRLVGGSGFPNPLFMYGENHSSEIAHEESTEAKILQASVWRPTLRRTLTSRGDNR